MDFIKMTRFDQTGQDEARITMFMHEPLVDSKPLEIVTEPLGFIAATIRMVDLILMRAFSVPPEKRR
jgi:hypothetical protein